MLPYALQRCGSMPGSSAARISPGHFQGFSGMMGMRKTGETILVSGGCSVHSEESAE